MIIWRFTDGKLGHENQTNGLVSALGKQVDVVVEDIAVPKLPNPISLFLRFLFRIRGNIFPSQKPDLIIGAGHKTHFPILVARSLFGGKSIVVMRPSLPLNWFDLVVVPKHDKVPPQKNVIETDGALNNVEFVENKDQTKGLVLLGGESTHFHWDAEQIISQLITIHQENSEMKWTLTTSRRTPSEFLQKVRESITESNLTIVPFEETDKSWMSKHFAQSSQIWVTPDSVSMVYEALSSGASTRVFSLQSKGSSRVTDGLGLLIKEGRVGSFENWKQNPVAATPVFFNESSRIAAHVLEHLI
ncbi:mitochondrial fission ELM1 family protein [PVC group bacterium]|nr:mitochondrial fission ELM1 family protein [PVC group bacterium]